MTICPTTADSAPANEAEWDAWFAGTPLPDGLLPALHTTEDVVDFLLWQALCNEALIPECVGMPLPLPTRKCSKCRQVKSIDEFHIRRADKIFGKQGYCKECQRLTADAWYANRGERAAKAKTAEVDALAQQWLDLCSG